MRDDEMHDIFCPCEECTLWNDIMLVEADAMRVSVFKVLLAFAQRYGKQKESVQPSADAIIALVQSATPPRVLVPSAPVCPNCCSERDESAYTTENKKVCEEASKARYYRKCKWKSSRVSWHGCKFKAGHFSPHRCVFGCCKAVLRRRATGEK